MTTYEHLCENCNNEFELEYGMKEPVPTLCPLCGFEGKVKRLISGGSGPGIVELTGMELKQSIREQGQQLKREAMRNENTLANLVGENKYQSNTVSFEKNMKNLGIRR